MYSHPRDPHGGQYVKYSMAKRQFALLAAIMVAKVSVVAPAALHMQCHLDTHMMMSSWCLLTQQSTKRSELAPSCMMNTVHWCHYKYVSLGLQTPLTNLQTLALMGFIRV